MREIVYPKWLGDGTITYASEHDDDRWIAVFRKTVMSSPYDAIDATCFRRGAEIACVELIVRRTGEIDVYTIGSPKNKYGDPPINYVSLEDDSIAWDVEQ